MRSRAVLIAVSAMMLFAAHATSAAACNEPAIGGPESAGPGDTVAYTVSNLQPGAEYTIYLDDFNMVIDRGTSTSESFSGTFVMPDLGASRGVALMLHAEHVVVELDPAQHRHPPGPYHHADWLQFIAPATASAPASSADVTASASEVAKPAGTSAVPPARPSAPAAARRPGTTQRPPARSARTTRSAPAAARAAVAPATATPASAPAPAAQTLSRRALERPAAARPGPAVAAGTARTPFSDAASRAPAATVAAPARDTTGAPPVALIALLALLIAHIAVSLVALWRPIPPRALPIAVDDAIERELQELILAERARVGAGERCSA